MKPWEHAKHSVKKWGGTPEEYLPIHDFIDSSKAHFPDVRHRALLHSSFGIYITEMVFGTNIELKPFKRWVNGVQNTTIGRTVSVRDIAEVHILQDMGTIPTVQDYLQHLPMLDWLGGSKKQRCKLILTERTTFID